jgi:hypothetical protein
VRMLVSTHRVADGAQAARFVCELGELIGSPQTALLELEFVVVSVVEEFFGVVVGVGAGLAANLLSTL